MKGRFFKIFLPIASPKRSQKKDSQKSLNLPPLAHRFSSLLLISLGAAIILFASFLKIVPNNQAQVQSPSSNIKPQKLYIPKLSKVLYVSDGYVVDNRWTVAETGVSYYTSSAIPGQTGNSVIYGHNRKDILGGLPRLASGDSLYVVLNSGDFVKYRVFETKEIKPNQVEILNQSSDARLTVYTCSGFLDQARFVVIAQKVDVTS